MPDKLRHLRRIQWGFQRALGNEIDLAAAVNSLLMLLTTEVMAKDVPLVVLQALKSVNAKSTSYFRPAACWGTKHVGVPLRRKG